MIFTSYYLLFLFLRILSKYINSKILTNFGEKVKLNLNDVLPNTDLKPLDLVTYPATAPLWKNVPTICRAVNITHQIAQGITACFRDIPSATEIPTITKAMYHKLRISIFANACECLQKWRPGS